MHYLRLARATCTSKRCGLALFNLSRSTACAICDVRFNALSADTLRRGAEVTIRSSSRAELSRVEGLPVTWFWRNVFNQTVDALRWAFSAIIHFGSRILKKDRMRRALACIGTAASRVAQCNFSCWNCKLIAWRAFRAG